MIYSPIYKDLIYRSGDLELDYKITCDNKTLHSAYTTFLPGNSGVTIAINNKVEEHLNGDMADFREVEDAVLENPNAFNVFTLLTASDHIIENYGILYDWSYESDWNGDTEHLMTTVVNGHIDPRMKAFATYFNRYEADIEWEEYIEDRLTIKPKVLERYHYTGGTQGVSFTTNVPWSFSGPDWISFTTVSGEPGHYW